MPAFSRHVRTLTALAAAATALSTAAVAPAATRAPIRDCGDMIDNTSAGASAITAQGRGLSCTTARAVADQTQRTRKCTRTTIAQCTVRRFSCFVAQVGKELYLASCQNSNATKFVRFEFGS